MASELPAADAGNHGNPPTPPRQYPCAGCGASFEFSPGAKALKCPYCQREERLPSSSEEVEELSFEQHLATARKPLAKIAPRQIRCPGCGAVVATEARSDSCPYCNVAIIIEDDPTELIAPEAILPFKVDASRARDLFRRWIASMWFAPKALKHLAAEERLRGLYLPYWTYDCFTRSFYTGARGEHYWVTQTFTVLVGGKPQIQTRQVRKTRWYPASGRVERWFDEILIPATTKVDAKRLAELKPWDLKALEPFRPEYLPGFHAGRYDVDLSPGFESAKTEMNPIITEDCRRDIGGDEQRVDTVRTAYSAITFKHILLPVWMAAYRFRNRTWQVLVNARTGEVIGERPWSASKISAVVVLGLAVVAAIIYFATRN